MTRGSSMEGPGDYEALGELVARGSVEVRNRSQAERVAQLAQRAGYRVVVSEPNALGRVCLSLVRPPAQASYEEATSREVEAYLDAVEHAGFAILPSLDLARHVVGAGAERGLRLMVKPVYAVVPYPRAR
jgi:hypothetical protein